MTDGLVAFLRARLDERQHQAPDVHTKGCAAHCEHSWGYEFHPEWCECGEPARVLREVAAKRRIIDEHSPVDPCDAHDAELRSVPCDTLRLLALPYEGHPDYCEEWRL